LTVNNNATLGSSNTDSLDVRARISSDLDPETNNAKDIGTNGRNWRDGFFGRTVHTVNLELTGTTSFDGSQGTSGQVLTSAGTGNTPTWTTPTTGTVTSVSGTGTVSGISLSGTVTSSGSLTLGGSLNLASPPAIGGTTPAAGNFTTLGASGTITAPLLADAQGGVLAPISSVMRNRIINGAMVIDQRNAGASVTPTTTSNGYAVDRFGVFVSQNSKLTVQQNAGSVTPPTGYTNYLGVTSSSAYAITSSDFFGVFQYIEGFNTADLGWGTANAQTVTLSFWVRSSLTGNFGGAFTNSAFNRSYPFSYTISAANTWEQKTITVAGDTSGTWLTNNGAGVRIFWGLGIGSTNSGTAGAWVAGNLYSATGATSVVGTSGATFYITGVQLEVGTQATSFEYRQYQQELALCQRYYYKIKANNSFSAFANGFSNSATEAIVMTNFPVSMRAAPTALEQSGTANQYQTINTAGTTCSAVPAFNYADTWYATTSATVALGLIANQAIMLRALNTNAFLAWSAEL
jgi:hypothetical protein